MTTMHFPKKHENLVNDLTQKLSHNLPAIFPNMRDLMLFAAMVGKKHGQVVNREGTAQEVTDANFASSNYNKDGVIYILGLLDLSGPEVLKDGAKECWALLEQYCAGGMDIIDSWLSITEEVEKYPGILQEKIMEVAHTSKPKPKVIVKPSRKLKIE